jgi:phosphoglycolate phosphatase
MAAIVFDLDGTLIDSAPDLHAIANDLLAAEGAGPITLDQARQFIGQGAAVFVARMRATAHIPDSEQARLLAAFVARYDGAVHLTRPYRGVRGALKALAGAGHVLGVCTNKPIAPCRAVLAHLRLDGFFATMVGGDSLPVHKPDPAPLRAAFGALGAATGLFVGDSEIDAETADRAGVPCLLFSQGYSKRPVAELPHAALFHDFADLPDLVARHLPQPA